MLVTVSNWKLVVAVAQIQTAEASSTLEPLQKLIDPRQRVGVDDRLLVERTVIDAQPKLTVFLLRK